MTVAAARRVALKALGRIRRDAAFSGPVLAAEISRAELSPEDVALATRLTYGVLAAQGVLDDVIGRHSHGQLEPLVRDALRLAAFEILFGRTPVYAVVDQAVSAVRRVRPQAAGLANAVLRRVAADAEEFPWGDPTTELNALARAAAHPRWIVDLVLRDLGEARGREMLGTGIDAAPTYVRLDPFAEKPATTLLTLETASPRPSPPDIDCLRLGTPAAALRRPAPGWFPMDAAAQMAPAACRTGPGVRVLEIGAGRGNKTVCLQSIALRRGGPADILALDVHDAKTSQLRDRLATSRVPGVRAVTGDALGLDEILRAEGPFDVALLDAPCSGLGTLRRYPEKRWRLSPDTPERMSALQLSLLVAAASSVGAHGRVVYSTCSVARLENDDVVDAFLEGETGVDFEIEPLGELVPAEWSHFTTRRGCFQSWPTAGGPDGHYVAVLRRTDMRETATGC